MVSIKAEFGSSASHWSKNLVAISLTLILAVAVRGDVILLLSQVYLLFYGGVRVVSRSETEILTLEEIKSNTAQISDRLLILARYRLKDVHVYVFASLIVSFTTYYSLAGFFHWYYYVKRREQALEWKCQPKKFLSPDNKRHEILMGSFNMALGAIVSGFIASYTINGGYTTLYFKISDYGWPYFLISAPLLHFFTESLSYYVHRAYHTPYLYKTFHKSHHRYHSPTAFSSTAMAVTEFFSYQAILTMPMFLMPIHPALFIGNLLYNYYYGLVDHSGIKLEAIWPWQPNSTFHDNHHQYFHCNFGINTKFFDWFHDTLKKNDRLYTEETFGGKGQKIK